MVAVSLKKFQQGNRISVNYFLDLFELLVFDLFQLYLGKSILPKCETHPFNGNGASTIEGKQILVHVTTGHAMLRVNHEKGERNEKDVAYEVFTLSS